MCGYWLEPTFYTLPEKTDALFFLQPEKGGGVLWSFLEGGIATQKTEGIPKKRVGLMARAITVCNGTKLCEMEYRDCCCRVVLKGGRKARMSHLQ